MATKKILILSSYGGYGHIAAANTMQKLLGAEYEFKTIYPIKELRICGLPAGEELYNWMLSNNFTRVTNLLAGKVSPTLMRQREKKLERQIGAHVDEYKPDIIVSLIPMVNFSASEVARKRDLPFLLITTDNDLQNWVMGLRKRVHTNFRVTIGSDLPSTRGLLLKHGVGEGEIQMIGLPLRPEFLSRRSRSELRAEYGIAESKKVVLLMAGGAGSSVTCKYTKSLMESRLDLHLLVCAGRSAKLAAKLRKISQKNGNTMEVIPFTEKIHELCGLADLLITKPGPGTVNEAFSLKLPILIDETNDPLFWEAANIDLVLRSKVGDVVSSHREAPEKVRRFLYDSEVRERVFEAYKEVPKNCFAQQIGGIIEEMIQKTPSEKFLSSSSL